MTMKKKSKKAADPSTLFVKFHPPSASITRQHLSNYFSYWGPVNKCSVIRNKSSSKQQVDGEEDINGDNGGNNVDRGSKGYGFVRFVNEEDAISAANAIKKLQQQQGRGKKRGKDTNSSGEEYMVVDGVQYKIHAERAVDAELQNKKGNNNSTQKKSEQVANKVTPPTKSTTSNTTKATSSSTPPSPSSTNNNTIDPETLYKTESKRKRTSRVIIRNLSFYANESHIKKCMEENFGPVSVVDLPLVPSLPGEDDDNGKGKSKQRAPRHRGFAFVTFTNSNAARLAVDREEELKIKNRVVAIDFSVSKAEHQKMQREGGSNKEEDGESESDSESDEENEKNEKDSNGSDSSSSSDDDTSDSEDSSNSDDDDDADNEDKTKVTNKKDETKDDEPTPTTPTFDTENESKRTLFLRNIPFDATRHDVFDLFRKFGRIEGVYLVKDKMTGVFKGTAFVRFESEKGCMAAMEASGSAIGEETHGDHQQQFVSSKNMAMGSSSSLGTSSLTLKGRSIFIDLAVDRTTASSLAIQRDDEGKPIKKMIGKDRRNLYLKNEGRVSSSTESGSAREASAKHGGLWEDLPSGDRSKRERAFADKSTKLRSPLFFINPNRISIRNLSKHITESELKSLVFGALKKGLEEGLVTAQDAVAHWRAGGELPHAEVMRRATDPTLVVPPVDEKNIKESVASVYIDRDVSGGKKTADAPSRGFGFVELVHHTHALAVLRQLNNNPIYSAQYAAGGKHASESSKRGRKGKKGKVDPETGDELVSGDEGKIPRLIVEFAVENKVKARKQAEKVAQTKANKIKQRIEKKEKEQQDSTNDKKKEKKKGRGTLQREKKRARKEAGESGDKVDEDATSTKKQKLDHGTKADKAMEKKPKMAKPQKKKRKVNADEEQLEDMIRSYKSSFSQGGDPTGKKSLAEGVSGDAGNVEQPKKKSREQVAKKRWFE